MLFILWLVIRVLARQLVLPGADEATKDLEILVLQQQLRVLRRTAGRPRFTPLDRVLLAAASRALPRRRWASLFLVTPQTLPRWHRALVLRMARETPAGAASGSAGSCASSASESAPPRSGRCCDEAGWARRRGVADRHGRSSSKPRLRGSWRATSSRWRQSGSRRCTYCSSSRSPPGGS